MKKPENMFDETHVIQQHVCFSDEEENDSVTSKNHTSSHKSQSINNLVKLVEGADKSLAIQVKGQAPFSGDDNSFDSARPLLYINEDIRHVYVYKYCPNVTEGSSYKKWSLVNIWIKSRFSFAYPVQAIFTNCPHTLFNQTLIAGNWNELSYVENLKLSS